MISPAVLAAVGGLASSLALSRPEPYIEYEPINAILGRKYTPQNVNSEILAALVGRRQDALREALLARSLPFSNPLEALVASSPQLSVTETLQQEALVNQYFQRGREDALLSLLKSEALSSSFLPRNPALMSSTSVVTEPVVKQGQDKGRPPEMTNAVALEALGSFGIERRNRNVPYFDASKLEDPDPTVVSNRRPRGGISEPFPEKLHRMLNEAEDAGEADVVSFCPHGRAFSIHHAERFCREVMPRYFKLSRLSSFQRQLNLYGFTRITAGPDTGGYYHELFLKGRPALAIHIRRVGAPQARRIGRTPRPAHPPTVPDFYSMTPVKIAQNDGHSKRPATVNN
jgi:hypothetical protein